MSPTSRAGFANLKRDYDLPIVPILQFVPRAADEEWDEQVIESLRTGNIARAIELASFPRMLRAGNLTHQFLCYLFGAGVADGTVPTHAEVMRRDGSGQRRDANSQAWLIWASKLESGG